MNKMLQTNVRLIEIGRRSKSMVKRFDVRISKQETRAL